MKVLDLQNYECICGKHGIYFSRLWLFSSTAQIQLFSSTIQRLMYVQATSMLVHCCKTRALEKCLRFPIFICAIKKHAHVCVCVFVCWIQYNEALFSNQRRREFITLVNEGARARGSEREHPKSSSSSRFFSGADIIFSRILRTGRRSHINKSAGIACNQGSRVWMINDNSGGCNSFHSFSVNIVKRRQKPRRTTLWLGAQEELLGFCGKKMWWPFV